jgi:NADH dehydrogenase
MDANTPHVVIVGGGFAGLAVAKQLGRHRVNVTLLDRRNFHVFQPLLYQVATGGLSPADICAPLRWVLRGYKNVRTLLAEVTGFDLPAKKVIMGETSISYDFLVIAAGARHHYFGHDEWEQYAPGLKTIEDATEIRARVLQAFEEAEREADEERRRRWLTFVIVGGGPTGVELAGALGEIANDTLKGDFRSFRPEEARILLLESGARILSSFPESLAASAEKDLISLGVRVRTGTLVIAVDPNGVTLKAGGAEERIESCTVLWGAGVKASPLAGRLRVETDRAGRAIVRPTCQLPDRDNVFVIGDMAHCKDEDGQPLPGVAPVAMQQGAYVADAIATLISGGTLAPFRYRNKGNLATIGRAKAIADFGKLRFHGYFAWLLWLFIHIMYLVGFRNRLQVFINWAFQYFTFNRGARLITGDPHTSDQLLPSKSRAI